MKPSIARISTSYALPAPRRSWAERRRERGERALLAPVRGLQSEPETLWHHVGTGLMIVGFVILCVLAFVVFGWRDLLDDRRKEMD